MALLPATLASALIANIDNFTMEAQATAAWADSFDTYFQTAMAGAVPIIPPPFTATADARDQMEDALTGMSVQDMGSTKIVAGITAYWTQLTADATTIFSACTAIAAPGGLAALKGLLDLDFASNTTGVVAKEAALTTIANTIHTAQSGGTATFPAPVGVQTIV